ncbi:MAG: cobalt ABC transporter [Micrococcales bacterium]|nr:MAG: cobalt ABC transporter [Micrococcales bacterium]PIE26471.1 MAG: cobalt ABC transporter [Micrococcales bacterium]
MPAGRKLLTLALLGAVSVLLRRWWWLVVVLNVVVAVMYRLAGFGPAVLWRQIRPMGAILVVTAGFHLWFRGWISAVATAGTITMLVTAAALVTLTTPTTVLLNTVVRAAGPLRRVGVDPERLGLYLTIGIRCVPLVASLAAEVREAQIARQATYSAQAFAVPFIVRSLREADAMGEALVARGGGD